MVPPHESNDPLIGASIRRLWIPIALLLLFAPLAYTGPHILLDSQNPEGNVAHPPDLVSSSDGLLLVILDGVGEDFLFDEQAMPLLNSRKTTTSYLSVRTGPLTLSATCISELMTGVPNSPIDGMNNFNLQHPGGDDPWTLAAQSERFSVGMVGSYVMENIYDGTNGIEFINTFQGNSDYYAGDEETSVVLEQWLDDQSHDVIAAHFSGTDKVGHKWGTGSTEYDEKLTSVDELVHSALQKVPQTWTVMVTADHGMTEIGSHGSAEDITRNVGALVYGPDIVGGSSASVIQRDLTALTSAALGLPFPIQLNGRIPVEVFDVPSEQKLRMEQWNWEAAHQRQRFVNELNGQDSSSLSIDTIDWNAISTEGVFVRSSDIGVSITTWIVLGLCSVLAVNPRLKSNPSEVKFIATYLFLLGAFLLSNASLWYSAMIPRALGAAGAVWVVAWSLGSSGTSYLLERDDRDETSDLDSTLSFLLFNGFRVWGAVVLVLFALLGSISQSVVLTCMLWVIVWSVGAGTNMLGSRSLALPSYAPWLLAFATFTFGSIRLWFVLIPFFFITLRVLSLQYSRGVSMIHQLPILSLSILLLAALSFVHKRIFGTHYMLLLVKSGWPESFQSTLFSVIVLIIAATVSVTCMRGRFERKTSALLSIVLLCGLAASGLQSNFLDRIILLMIAVSYLLSFASIRHVKGVHIPDGLGFAALSVHMVMIWGAWSAAATLVLLSCIGPLWNFFQPLIPKNPLSLSYPRPALILAVLPWIVWVLWWTLLGQVNGVQTCFEGICPHPRELDFGRIIIKGGSVGFQDDPSNLWIGFMVASPLLIASTMMMHEFVKRGMSLRPYAVSQFLLVLGSMSILAFSPPYPRLMFSLAWNMTFALFQFMFAVTAVAAYRLIPRPVVEPRLSHRISRMNHP
ncbi:MAG: hypothetical protein CMA63_05950 [Euryarchaeota archaeon]|nr:hypothetical protein [Euryarchaeota archaeon]